MIKPPQTLKEYVNQSQDPLEKEQYLSFEKEFTSIPEYAEIAKALKSTKWLNVASWHCTFKIVSLQRYSDEYETKNSYIAWSGSGRLVSKNGGKYIPHARSEYEIFAGKEVLLPFNEAIWVGKDATILSGETNSFYSAIVNKETNEKITSKEEAMAQTGHFKFPNEKMSFSLSFRHEDNKVGLSLGFPKPVFKGHTYINGGSLPAYISGGCFPAYLTLPDNIQPIKFNGAPIVGHPGSSLEVELTPLSYYAIRLYDETTFQPIQGIQFKLICSDGTVTTRLTNENGVIELPCKQDASTSYVIQKVSDRLA